MKFPESKGIRAGQWYVNETLRNEDINFLNEKEYTNTLAVLAAVADRDMLSGKDIVMSGMLVEHTTALTMSLKAGMALSPSGYYMQSGSWGFNVSVGDIFGVVIPIDTLKAVVSGGTLDRIDVLEIRPVRAEYDSQSRAFKDPVTGLVTSANVDTKVEYGFEAHFIQGVENASPVASAHTVGWIKIAEVYVAGSASSITQDDIKGIEDSGEWTLESGITVFHGTALEVVVNNKKRPAIDNTIIPHFIGQAFTNLVQDPTDLTTANWTPSADVTVSDSGKTINGEILWNVKSDIVANYKVVDCLSFVCTSTDIIFQAVINKSDSDLSRILLRNNTTGLDVGFLEITFSTKTLLEQDSAILLDYTWLDDNTVELIAKADSTGITIGDSLKIRLYGVVAVAGALSTNFTMPQITEGATMFPFVDGTHSADVINETFTMPDKFAVDMIIEPKFAFDTASNMYFFAYYISSTQYLWIYYRAGSDHFRIEYQDNGAIRSVMQSQQFDNGSSFTNINQRIRLIGFINTTTGDTTGSSFICIPLESGSLSEDILWDQNADPLISNFVNAYIGYDGTGNQADSEYELLRVYSWEGGTIPTIASSEDANQYFQTQSMTYEAIPDAFIPREIPINTPISSALQQITDDIRIGQGIQDGAVIDRHLNAISVDLNTTHRGSDGKNHSDVVLNNTHRSSDGKNHSDVVLNNTHRGSDGSDHIFIDQDVKTTASPKFEDITIGNIDYIGTPSLIGLLGSGLSVSGAGGPALCSMDSSHIAFLDSAMESLRQYEWNGSTWSLVGSGLTISGIGRPALATLNSTTIVFIDGTLASLRTYSFNGSIWSQVGNSLSIPGVGDVALAPLDSTHIALIGSGSLVLSTYEWDGSDWSLIGSSLSISGILTPAITKLDSSHIAFIADTMESLRQYEWNGSTWSLVGSGLTISGIGRPALASTEKNHVIFIDDILEVLRIYQWTGSTWTLIGTPLTISGIAWPALAAMDSNIIYCDGTLDSLRTYEYNHSLKSRRH